MSIFARVVVLLMAGVVLAGCAGDLPFKRGEKYAIEGDWDRAVLYYRQALQEDPENISYQARLTKAQDMASTAHIDRAEAYLREKNADTAYYEAQQAFLYSPMKDRARQLVGEAAKLREMQGHFSAGQSYYAAGRPNEALGEFQKVIDYDPDNKEAKEYIERITKQKAQVEQDDELTLASDQPITLSFKDAKLKEVFEFLSKLSGVSILFDEDVKDQPVTVFAKDVSFRQALNLLLATNKLFMKKIASDAIIIIPKTKSKLDQYQDLLMRTFYLSHIQAKDMVNIIRTMLETRKVIINEKLNAITLRETPDKLKLVEKLIDANDRQDSEVVIDVEVMLVDRGDSRKWGINLPKGVSGTYVPGGVAPAVDATSGALSNVLTNFATMKDSFNPASPGSVGGNIWFTYPAVTVDWSQTRSHGETLTNPQIRAINGKPAKILIGRRIPVQTGTAVAGSITTSTFEYRDVGIKLNVEPDIGLGNDVTLKTTLEVSSLETGGVSVGGVTQPSFSTTTAETTLNLKDGETVIIGGLLENVKAKAINGVVGVMDVPILGKIFSTNTIGPNSKREIVMTMTPHIVRAQEVPGRDITSFWSGTEEAYGTKPLFEEKKEKLSEPEPEETGGAAGDKAPGKARPTPSEAVEGHAPAAPSAKKMGRVGTISFAPEITPVDVGQEVTVDVMATDIDTIFEAPLSIIYNPKLVEFIKAEEGDFLKVDGKPTSFMVTVNDKVGFIDVFITRLGQVPGISGTGRLFSLTFKGKAAGISPLVFKQNMLKDANRQPVSADLKTGTLYVK